MSIDSNTTNLTSSILSSKNIEEDEKVKKNISHQINSVISISILFLFYFHFIFFILLIF